MNCFARRLVLTLRQKQSLLILVNIASVSSGHVVKRHFKTSSTGDENGANRNQANQSNQANRSAIQAQL